MSNIHERLEVRIRTALAGADEPMKIRDLQIRTANRDWKADDFRAVLRGLIERRVVWHGNGYLRLLDRTPVQASLKRRYDFPNTSDL